MSLETGLEMRANPTLLVQMVDVCLVLRLFLSELLHIVGFSMQINAFRRMQLVSEFPTSSPGDGPTPRPFNCVPSGVLLFRLARSAGLLLG